MKTIFQAIHNNTMEQFEIAEMPENNHITRRNICSIERMDCFIWIISGVGVVSFIAATSLILFLVVFKSTPKTQFFNTTNNASTSFSTVPTLSSSSSSSSALIEAFANSMANGSIFPTGSYALKLSP